MEAFADVRLGKAVVRCNDTPGFVANRLGVYWIATAIGEALARGLTVEEADVLMGEAIGAPRTGVFGLMDLVGIGLHEHVTASLDRLLPAGDPWRAVPPQMRRVPADWSRWAPPAAPPAGVLRARWRHSGWRSIWRPSPPGGAAAAAGGGQRPARLAALMATPIATASTPERC